MEIVLTVFLSCYSLLCFIFCRFLYYIYYITEYKGHFIFIGLILSLAEWFDQEIDL